jgi:hypothetical protein
MSKAVQAASERRIAVQEAQEALRREHGKLQIEASGVFQHVTVQQWLRINDMDVYKFIEADTPMLPGRWALIQPRDEVQVFMSLDDLAEEL